jgi:hypothetical protein
LKIEVEGSCPVADEGGLRELLEQENSFLLPKERKRIEVEIMKKLLVVAYRPPPPPGPPPAIYWFVNEVC